MPEPAQLDPNQLARLRRTDLLLPGGGSRPVSRSELERLVAAGDQETLENLVFEFEDGERIRPYRFASVEPVRMDGTTLVL